MSENEPIKITDKRRWMPNAEVECCRVCGSREVHSQAYGKPTVDCITSMREENNVLNQKLSEIQAELKEAWSFSSKNGTQAREAERQIEVLREALKHLRNAVTFANPSEINGVEVYEALVPIGFVKIANDALLSTAPSEKSKAPCNHDLGDYWGNQDHKNDVFKTDYPACPFCPAPSEEKS